MLISEEMNDQFKGTRLESSNDNLTFNKIMEFDEYMTDGWYLVNVEESVQEARYWRIKQENSILNQYSL